MTFKTKLKLTVAVITILLGGGHAMALPGGQIKGSLDANQTADGYVHEIAQRKIRRARRGRLVKRMRKGFGGATGFASNGGVVKDTCTSSHPFYGGDCSPQSLTSRCDAAGGGMSSEPGGGVTCDTSHWD